MKKGEETRNELTHQIKALSDQRFDLPPNAQKLIDQSEARTRREFSEGRPKVNQARGSSTWVGPPKFQFNLNHEYIHETAEIQQRVTKI